MAARDIDVHTSAILEGGGCNALATLQGLGYFGFGQAGVVAEF